jgi:hypothetical protein
MYARHEADRPKRGIKIRIRLAALPPTRLNYMSRFIRVFPAIFGPSWILRGNPCRATLTFEVVDDLVGALARRAAERCTTTARAFLEMAEASGPAEDGASSQRTRRGPQNGRSPGEDESQARAVRARTHKTARLVKLGGLP